MKIGEFYEPIPTVEYGTVSVIGFFTLEGVPDVSYRFEYDPKGKAILQEDYFAKDQPEFEKRKLLQKDSSRYEEIQKLLNDYLKKDQKGS